MWRGHAGGGGWGPLSLPLSLVSLLSSGCATFALAVDQGVIVPPPEVMVRCDAGSEVVRAVPLAHVGPPRHGRTHGRVDLGVHFDDDDAGPVPLREGRG